MLGLTVLEAGSNLLAYRQRSILSLVGILIGAGAVIAMINIGAMARNETMKQFEQMGIDLLSVRSTEPAGLRPVEVEAVGNASGDFASVAPVTAGGSAVTVYDGRPATPTVVGASDGFERIARLRRREGRFISALDRFELFCVLGDGVARTLSQGGAAIGTGSDLRIGRYVFRVVGVLRPTARSPMLPFEVDDAVFVSLANARRVLGSAPIAQVLGRLRPGVAPNRVAERLTAYYDGLPGGSKVQVSSAQQLLDAMASQMRLFQLLLGVIGGISLVLGGVGVMNIMLVSVQERHQEIGIRLAIGARRRDIQVLFLSEATILAVLGGVLGIGLGLAGSYGFARFSGWDFVVSAASIPLGSGVSIGVGIFFGFYPAFLASRLDPITALRAE